MARRYDAAACSTELLIKQDVLSAVNSGWTIAEVGELPRPRPPPKEPAPPQVHRPQKHRPPLPVTTVDINIPKVSQVLHLKRHRLHLYEDRPGNQATACMFWTCGTVQNPSTDAKFFSGAQIMQNPTEKVAFCKPCFNWIQKLVGHDAEEKTTEDEVVEPICTEVPEAGESEPSDSE